MLKTLLKKQMAEIFRNYFYDPKKNKMRSRGATIAYIALYALLMVGLLGGMFALMAVGLCGPLVEGGMGWLYYLLMGLIAVFLGTFGSVGAGDWLAMGIVTVTQAALLALTLWGIARSFLKIATATGSVKKVRFEHRAVRAQSVQRALFGKELRRFTASPNYMLNCGLGILMLPVAGIVLLIKGGALGRMLADVFSGNVGVVPVLMCAAVCLLASMNDMAAPAVSLEGRQLWLAQSLPVVPWQALRAKLDVQLVLTGVPVLFCALCMVIALPGSALEKTLLVIVALLYTLLSALAALALGLKMPNLTWTNETTPIKQSGCVMLSLFANWFYALALGGLYFLCGNALSAAVYLAIFAVVTAAGSALLLHWVKQRGARIFAAL